VRLLPCVNRAGGAAAQWPRQWRDAGVTAVRYTELVRSFLARQGRGCSEFGRGRWATQREGQRCAGIDRGSRSLSWQQRHQRNN
jgi:hypothetical protein